MLDLPSNWHPIFMYLSVVFICLLAVLQIATWLTSSPQKKDELIFLKEKLILITTLALISTIYSGWSLLTENPLSHSLPERITTYKYWIILTVAVFLSAVILFLITKEFRENTVGLLLVFSSVLVIITTIKGSGIYYRYG